MSSRSPFLKGLRQQNYDAIFAAFVPDETDLEFIPVLGKRLVAVVHNASYWAKKNSFSLKYLDHVKYSTYTPGTPIGNETKQLLDRYEAPAPTLTFDDEFMLSNTVVANRDLVGIMLDTFQIDPFKDRVSILPIEEVSDNWHSICLVHDPRLHQSKATQRFIDVTRSFSEKYLAATLKNDN